MTSPPMPSAATIRQPDHERAIAKVAYEVSRAALDEQHESIRDLRARTGALLAATSVVVSFLGARALTTSPLRGSAFVGLGMFVCSLVACLYVLVPTAKIESLTQGGTLLDLTLADRDPVSDAYRRLTATCDTVVVTNESHIERLGRVFTLASVTIVVEVLLWGLQLVLA